MTSFVDLEVFVRTVDGGSFSAAARALDMTPAAASIAVKGWNSSWARGCWYVPPAACG